MSPPSELAAARDRRGGLPAYRTLCRIPGCTTLVGRKGAKGLCSRHYQRKLATGSPTGSNRPTPLSRFMEKVDLGECWVWTASLDQSGYGFFSGRPNGGTIRAHIWAYEHFVGPVPDGKELDHLCHTADLSCAGGLTCPHRRCVNPEHLEPVTPKVNSRRGVRCRPTEECRRGHPRTAVNTYVNPKGSKVCRQCMALYRTRWAMSHSRKAS